MQSGLRSISHPDAQVLPLQGKHRLSNSLFEGRGEPGEGGYPGRPEGKEIQEGDKGSCEPRLVSIARGRLRGDGRFHRWP